MTLRERYDAMTPEKRLWFGGTIAGLLFLAILYSELHDLTGKLERQRTSREAVLKEMLVLKQRYREAGAGAQQRANLLAAVTADDSLSKLLDEIGIKGKSSQIKALKGEERTGYREEAAEVTIEGVTANETVNLLYRLEQGGKPVQIRRANLKTRYDDPAKLDLDLVLVLLKPVSQENR